MVVSSKQRSRGSKGGVGIRWRKRDVVPRSETEQEWWLEGAFEVDVVFAFWEGGEKGVERGTTHAGSTRGAQIDYVIFVKGLPGVE